MPLASITRHAREMWEVPRDLLLRRYPDFVTGGALPRGHVPFFCFHSVEPESFERTLRYLRDNRYVTLAVDEYFQILMGGRAAPERAVLLTFDDGRGSLWSVGAPLLRRYGMRGTVFLVPGRVPEQQGAPAPTLDDVHRDGVPLARVLQREREQPFLSWDEIVSLQRAGTYDFESHTLTHGRIHVSPHIAGFLAPPLRQGLTPLDVPLVHRDGRDLFAGDAPLGTPLLASAPRTSEALRFYEEPDVAARCVDVVESNGGAAFFARPDWEKRLYAVAGSWPLRGRVETPADREQALRHELAESRRMIEERTSRTVRHLCYPWHVSGVTARRLAEEAGYRTAFCGKVDGVTITLPGGDPQRIARIGEDYVFLLPGAGRDDLTRILRRKWARRLGRR